VLDYWREHPEKLPRGVLERARDDTKSVLVLEGLQEETNAAVRNSRSAVTGIEMESTVQQAGGSEQVGSIDSSEAGAGAGVEVVEQGLGGTEAGEDVEGSRKYQDGKEELIDF